MTLEIWILLTLAAALVLLGAASRLRRRRLGTPREAERNVYPLW